MLMDQDIENELSGMENLKETLLSQLHEQYAINDNAKNQNFITFLVAIFALLGAYGYVYVHTNVCNCSKLVISCSSSDELVFAPQILIIMTALVSLIMLFLSCLVIILGYSTRRDHIMIYRIRNYAIEGQLNKYLFKNNLFNPLGKTTCDFLPDYYKLFFWTFQVINWGVLGLTYMLLKDVCSCCICFWISVAVFVTSIIILCQYYCKYSDYIESDDEPTTEKTTCKYKFKLSLLLLSFKKEK